MIRGSQIGKNPTSYYTWRECTECGLGRWVQMVGGMPRSELCAECSLKYNKRRNYYKEDK